jgi:hypothetical protein
MLSTGLSVLEYLRENTGANSNEICDFVESNAEFIVNDTISHLKGAESGSGENAAPGADNADDEDSKGESTDEWPLK